jgi:excisionase family DNA binding protein
MATVTKPRRYATLAEAAFYARLSEKTVRRWISQGSITGFRIGSRHIRVDLNEVDARMRPIPVNRPELGA